jgi:hypothetical protein
MAQTFFDTLKARWTQATKAEEALRQLALADLKFDAGEHWKPEVKADRDAQGKPALVIDLLSGPIKQVTNAQRNARPGIQVSPVGNGADRERAEVWQGILRRIERLSQAGKVYAHAGAYQVRMGWGIWKIENIEIGEDGEQDLRIVEVDNPFTVYLDPTAKKLNGEDRKWAIQTEDLTHEEYIERFGESKLADSLSSNGTYQGTGDAVAEWISSEYVRIAAYYVREETTRTRLILSSPIPLPDGTVSDRVWAEDVTVTMGAGKRAKRQRVLPEGVEVVREVSRPKVTIRYYCVNGIGEILDDAVIPGEFIPFVRIVGERRNINGQIDLRGMVRMSKDPSRMEDFAESSLMETISLAKTAPWVAPWESIAEFKDQWETSNRANYAVLPYKALSDSGQPLPMPQRMSAGVDVTALTLAAQRMQNHVRNVTGVSDLFQEESAAQQANSSGRAILARKQNQELTTSDYMDNLADGIVLTGKILMSMARVVYDTPRVLRILGKDESERPIVVHAGDQHRPYAENLVGGESGLTVNDIFDASVGEYDVSVTAGKFAATARQEAVDSMQALLPVIAPINPQMALKATSILVKSLDGPGMQELAAALDPPEAQQIPDAVKQHLQQADQMLQMAQQQIQQLQQEKQTRVIEGQMKQALEELKGQQALLLKQLEGQQALRLQLVKGDQALALQDDAQAHERGLRSAEAGHDEHMSNIIAARQMTPESAGRMVADADQDGQ